MSETPNQKRRREQHEKSLAMFDTLINGLTPMMKLVESPVAGPDGVDDVAYALGHAATGIGIVLSHLRADAVEDYEKTRDWT
jgi:hypothetical protein